MEEGESLHVALARELTEECALEAVALDGPIAIVESIAPAGPQTAKARRPHHLPRRRLGPQPRDRVVGRRRRARPPARVGRRDGVDRPAPADPSLPRALAARRSVRAPRRAVGQVIYTTRGVRHDHGAPVRPRRHARRRGACRCRRIPGDGGGGSRAARPGCGRPRPQRAIAGARPLAGGAGLRVRRGDARHELVGGAVVQMGGRRRRGAHGPGVGGGLQRRGLADRARRPRRRRHRACRGARRAVRRRAPPAPPGVRRRTPRPRPPAPDARARTASPTEHRASSARSWPGAGSPRTTSTSS